MKEKMLEQFSFTDELKKKLVPLIRYQNYSVKAIAKRYNLPKHILNNWINLYQKKLEKGAESIDVMDPTKKKDPAGLKEQIKQMCPSNKGLAH